MDGVTVTVTVLVDDGRVGDSATINGYEEVEESPELVDDGGTAAPVETGPPATGAVAECGVVTGPVGVMTGTSSSKPFPPRRSILALLSHGFS